MACAEEAVRRRGALVFSGAAALAVALAFSPACFAQAPASGFSGLGGANSKKPIDIESDRLEVDDKKHLAIFIGSVSATQGDYNLKAPRLEVTYESAPAAQPQAQAGVKSVPVQKQPVKPVKAPANNTASGDPLSSGQIKFIHALGGIVILTSKKDQQEATGDDAVYDVKAKKITMTGKKVILTQKKSVVVGKKLLVDLATGQATVIPDSDPGQSTANAGKGRVRAVLQQEGGTIGGVNPFSNPDNKKPDAATQIPATPQQSAPTSSWQTQSR